MIVVRVLVFILGFAVVVGTIISAMRTFVLPRSARDILTTAVFRTTGFLFGLRTKRASSYAERDRVMALYAPVSLLLLPLAWLALVLVGYAGMFWALGIEPVER